jgi:hypothetical protein
LIKTCNSEELETQVPALLMGLLTVRQVEVLRALADRYKTSVDWDNISLEGAGLPTGWAAGQIGPVVVGVSPEGDIHS